LELKGVYGDGIVRSSSVPLEDSTDYKVNGQCSGSLNTGMHTELLNPTVYPEVLNKVIEFLRE